MHQVRRQSGVKRQRERGLLHLQLLWGPCWVSYKLARLLKPINGMAQCVPMNHCSAALFITSRADSVNSFPSCLKWLQAKGSGSGGWVLFSCDFDVLCWCLLHSTQLGDNQTDTSNMLLVTMPKFWRQTLIKLVGSQTRWREATQTCKCFNVWQEFCRGDRWKVGVISNDIHIQQKKQKKNPPAIPQRLWWTNWMRVLTLIWRFCALMGNNFSKAPCQTWSGFQNTPWSRNMSVYEKETDVQCFL